MIRGFLKSLPVVARHPFAFVAYLALAAVWLVTTLQVQKANSLFEAIKSLPETERLEAIKLEYKTVPKEGLSAEEWLQSQKTTFIFAGFASTLFSIIVLSAFALVRSKRPTLSHANIQSPNIGSVVGNIYITYSNEKETEHTIVDMRGVRFVTEDVSFNRALPVTSPHLDIRFTIYNSTPQKIKIYNFHTVEYHREQTIFYYGGPRIYLEITPDKPFIEQDKTFEIESQDSVSFRLRYNLRIGGGNIEVIIGIIAYYHISTGEVGKVVSDKLCLINPTQGRKMLFNGQTISPILDVENPASFSHGWAKDSAQREFDRLEVAWQQHVSIGSQTSSSG